MIAYTSPLIPKQTGIARFSHHLIKALKTQLALTSTRLDVFDEHVAETNAYQADYQAREIAELQMEQHLRDEYRHIIYHFGNNPQHLPLFNLLKKRKGIVVLHDTVMFFMMAGAGSGGLWQLMKHHNEPASSSIKSVEAILDASQHRHPLLYPTPDKHPFLNEVLEQASAVVVHSKLAKDIVERSGFSRPVHQLPLIDYQQTTEAVLSEIDNPLLRDLCEKKSAPQNGPFIIGLFGFGGPTKRSASVFKALSQLPEALRKRVKLIIIGMNNYQGDIDALGIADSVLATSYVSDTDYDQGLALCDLVVNLRYPSMGETSAVQIQAMSAKKPTIVSNHAWFSELPDNAVHKISVGDDEIETLVSGLKKVIEDRAYRDSLARNAQLYVSQKHSPEVVAQHWMRILEETPAGNK